jgi:hypothetical protein
VFCAVGSDRLRRCQRGSGSGGFPAVSPRSGPAKPVAAPDALRAILSPSETLLSHREGQVSQRAYSATANLPGGVT